MKKNLIFLAILFSVVVYGIEPEGNIYWVQFNSKANSTYTLGNPEYYLSSRAIARREKQNIAIDSTDLPVPQMFLDSITSLGFKVKHTSRWMNGAIAYFDSTISTDSIFKPSFVSEYQLRKGSELKSATSVISDFDTIQQQYYGNSYAQVSMLKGEIVHQYSKGEGVHVAVIDAGFLNSDKLDAFDSLFSRNGIIGTYDFVNPGNNVYNEHYHGNAVLSIMAGNIPGKLVGSAPDASYWLLRSEDVATEYPVEEDYWIVAAEFADRMGCDVINTSLGYNTFDNPVFNHTYEEFDGKSMRISKVANLAVDKGIVVVCSAGNSGDDAWKYIITPAEAEKVLAVGAVNSDGTVTKFSSRGFTEEWALPKPDVSAMGAGVAFASTSGDVVTGNGTSFSAPIVAGMAACLIAYYPDKTAHEIIDLIKSSGNLFPGFNTEYGYGIPDFSKLIKTEPADTTTTPTSVHNFNQENSYIYPNPYVSSIFIKNVEEFTSFELYSTSGLKVFSMQIDHENAEISNPILSSLKKGVYFAVLKGEQKVHTFKLIKN